jgi:maltose alpha-D-glucosyltransferase/alpha-amylase
MPKWLEDAVFYEIYPQTFYDSNGDGIGDIPGITGKLDYIRGLGCNALWINPCFDSPFRDAGYDVRDYKKVAPRYGTNEDLFTLFDEAHKRGMRVLLDLVAGHTSEEHEWFIESKKIAPNDTFRNRYIWTDNWYSWGAEGIKFIAGEAERNGCYVINFFKSQPALNYGFRECRESWQLPPEHPDCVATREALKDIIRFWLRGDKGRGCDGFRVDMADSLVKLDDVNKSATCAIWRNVREMLDKEFPEAAMISEWSWPIQSLKAGFHMDFLLNHAGGGYESLVRNYQTDNNGDVTARNSYFNRDSTTAITRFIDQYLPWYEATKNDGYISLITGNHDTPRISHGLSRRELALAFAFFYTMPGAPFLYYGDEIAMRYLSRVPTKEGGYTRTGSRTPMQWNSGTNKGFSTAAPDKLYLPVDSDPAAPNVAAQETDPDSPLNTVKALLRLRHGEADLQARPNFAVLHAPNGGAGDRSFFYRRGGCVVGVNPAAQPVQVPLALADKTLPASPRLLYSIGGGGVDGGVFRLDAQSFGVWKLAAE